jgi:hypothetical protein
VDLWMLEDVCMCHQLPECHPMGCYWMWPDYCLKLQFFIAKQNPCPPSSASGPFNICFGWKTCSQLLQATEGKLEGAWKREKGYNRSSQWDARTDHSQTNNLQILIKGAQMGMSGDMISTLTSFCCNCRNNYCQDLKP